MDPYIVRRIGDVTIERVLPKQQDVQAPVALGSGSKEMIPLNRRSSGDNIHGDLQEPLMTDDDNGRVNVNENEQMHVGNIGKYDSDNYLREPNDIDNSFVTGLTGTSMFGDLNDQTFPGMSMAKDWKLGSSISLEMVKPTSSSELPESLPESDDIQELAPVNISSGNSIKNIDNPLLVNKIDNTQYKLGTSISLETVSTPLTPVKDSGNLSFNNMSSSCEQQPSHVGNDFNQSTLHHNIPGANLENNQFTSNMNREMNMTEKSSFTSMGNLLSQMNSVSSSSFADENISNSSFINNSENERQNLSINKNLRDNNNGNFVQNDFTNSNNSQTNENSIGNISNNSNNNMNNNDNHMNMCRDNSSGSIYHNNSGNNDYGSITNLNPSNTGYNNSAPDIYNPNANFGTSCNDKPLHLYNYGSMGSVPQPSFGDSYNMDYKMGNMNLDLVGQSAPPNLNADSQKSSHDLAPASNISQMNCDNNSAFNSAFQNLNPTEMNMNTGIDNSYNINNNPSSLQQPINDPGQAVNDINNSGDYKVVGSGVNLNMVKSNPVKNPADDLINSRNEKSPVSAPSSTRPSSVNSMVDTDEYRKSLGNDFRLGTGVSLDVVRPKSDSNDFKIGSDISINVVRPTTETSQDSFNSNEINKCDNDKNPIETLQSLEMLNETDGGDNKDLIDADKEKKLIKLENMLGEDELDPDEEEEMYGNLEDEEQELDGDITKQIKMEMEDEADDKDEKLNEDDPIEDEADDEMGDGEEDDEDGQKRSKRKTPESDDDNAIKGEKKKQKSGNSDDSSSDSDTEKGLMERKTTNLRRNIREVMDESQLDQATLNAQRQEMERLRRVQEQHRIIREVQKQIQINKQNSKTQTRVISLLQGNTSVLKSNSGQSTSGAQSNKSNTVVVKLSSGSGAPQIVNKKVLEMLRNQKSTSTSTNTSAKMSNFAKNLSKPHMMTPSVSIAPVKPKSATCETSTDDLKISEHVSRKAHGGRQKGKDVVTISSSSSDEDDCILISEPSGGEDEDEEEDPTNSGMHTNDLYNVPDEQGRVLINVGKPDNDPEVFLAPQIARVIKPHQIGGVRFLFDNVVESLERFKTSSGFGCILAHSMGLGKTLQVVSFCDVFLRYTEARRILCIMPINTLQNWVAEFNMWLPVDPSNCPLAAHGEVRPRNFPIFVLNDLQKTVTARGKVIAEWSKQGGVLLIGYELYRQLSLKRPRRTRKSKKKPPVSDEDVEDNKNKPLLEEMHAALVKPGPDLVICDEGHRIKNSHASISQALKQIRSKRRIVLTGYPLQNNLLEYWCMVDFVRPNYLGTKTEFSNMFERPIQNGQCIDSTPQDIRLMRYRAHVLHSLLEGFVQRRSHSVLTNTLPQKEEYVLLVRMTAFQRQLYDTFMNEVVRTKAVPNPLKAFAVCCKIWNHPDVLYHFLKKRSNSGEAVDLDLDETAPIMPPPGTPTPGSMPGTPIMPGTPTPTKRGRGRGNAKNASPSQNKRERKQKTQSVVQPVNKSPAIAAVIPNTTSNNNSNNGNNNCNNGQQMQSQDGSMQNQTNTQSAGPENQQFNDQSNQQYNSNFNQYQQQPSGAQQQQPPPPPQQNPDGSNPSYPAVNQNNYNQNYNSQQGDFQNQYQQPFQNQQQSGNFNNSNNYYQNYDGYYPPQNNDPNFNGGNFWNNSYYNNDGQNNFYPGNQFGGTDGMQSNNSTSGWNQDNFQSDSNSYNQGFNNSNTNNNSNNNNNNNNNGMNSSFSNNQMGAQGNPSQVGMHQKSPNSSMGNQKADQTAQSSLQRTPLETPQQSQRMMGNTQNTPSNMMGDPPANTVGASQSSNMIGNSQSSNMGNPSNPPSMMPSNSQNMIGNSQNMHNNQSMMGNNQNQNITNIPEPVTMASSSNSQNMVGSIGQSSQQNIPPNMMGNQQNPQNMVSTNAQNPMNNSQNMQSNITSNTQNAQSYMNAVPGSQNMMNSSQNSQNMMGNSQNIPNQSNTNNTNMMDGVHTQTNMMNNTQSSQNMIRSGQSTHISPNMIGNSQSHSSNMMCNSQQQQNMIGNSQSTSNPPIMINSGQPSPNLMNNSHLSQNMMGNSQPPQNISGMQNTTGSQNPHGMMGSQPNMQSSQNLMHNPQNTQNFMGSDAQNMSGMMNQNLMGNNQVGSGIQNEMSTNSQNLMDNSQNVVSGMQNMPNMMNNNMGGMMANSGNPHNMIQSPQNSQNMMNNNQNFMGNMSNPNPMIGSQNQQNMMDNSQNRQNMPNTQGMSCNNGSQSNFIGSGVQNHQNMMNSVSNVMGNQVDPQDIQIGDGMQNMTSSQQAMLGNQQQNSNNQHNMMNSPNHSMPGIINQQQPPQQGGQNFVGNMSQSQNFIPDQQQNVMGNHMQTQQQMNSGNQQGLQLSNMTQNPQNMYHNSQQCMPTNTSVPQSPQTPHVGPPPNQSLPSNQQNSGQNLMGNNQQGGFHSQHNMLDNNRGSNTGYQSGYPIQNETNRQHEGLLDDLLNSGNNLMDNNTNPNNPQNPQQMQSGSMNQQQFNSSNNQDQSMSQQQQPPPQQHQNYQNNQQNFNNQQYNLGYQNVTNSGNDSMNSNNYQNNNVQNKNDQSQFGNSSNNNIDGSNNTYDIYGNNNLNNGNNMNNPNQNYQDFNRSGGYNVNNIQQSQPQQQQNYNTNNNSKQNEFNNYDQQWDVKLSPRSSTFNKDDVMKKEDCLGNTQDMKPFKDDTEMKSCGNQTDDKAEVKTETFIKDTSFSFGEMKEIPGGCSKNMKDVSTGDKAVGPDSKDDIKEFQAPVRGGREDPGIPYDWAERLLKGYSPGDIEASAKMAILFCILEESMSLGDRILVFSQSLFTLNLIEDFLQRTCLPGRTERWARNWNYYRLDGSTSALEREKLINEFNSNPNIHLFLVSTRAGSLGINLVGANRVIVFDASWNPCHDTQAVCRVYRYGQKKPCFVYRLVMDNCLEKKIYDRQINKQGMADRVVDECNPDAHLSIKEVTNLCWDSGESDAKPRDMSQIKDKYIDVVMQKVLDRYGNRLSKEPFQHESLLVDRKDKKLSQAEKRLAKRSYELEKQANINSARPVYGYTGTGNQPGLQIRPTFRAIRGDGVNVVNKPMASVRPMQSELNSQLVRDTGRPRSWIPAEVWQKQGMSAQEMTLPLDVVIPTNSPDRSSIVLKAGQKVMVLKSPKGIYMQLENGKIIAIRTAFKVGNKGEKKADKRDFATETKKEVAVQPTRQRIPTNLPMLRNNSNISIIPRSSPGMGNRSNNSTSTTSSGSNQSKPLVRMLGNSGRPWGTPKQPIATTKPYFGETPPVTVTVTKKKVDSSAGGIYRSDIRIERDHIIPSQEHKDKDVGMDSKDSDVQMMKVDEQKEINPYNQKDNTGIMSNRNERDMSSSMNMNNERNMSMSESNDPSKEYLEHHVKGKQQHLHAHHSPHHHLHQHQHQLHHPHHDDIHLSDEDDELEDDELDELDMHDEVHNISRSSSTTSSKKMSLGSGMGSSGLIEEGINCNMGVEEHERLKSVHCDNSMAPVSSVHPVRSDDKDKEFTARYPHMSHMPQKSASTETQSNNPSVSINSLPMLNSSITVSPVNSVSSSATSMSYNVPTMSSASSSTTTLPSLKSSVSINPLSNNPAISLTPGTPSVSINPIPINPTPTYHPPTGILPSSNNRKYTSMEYTADSLAKSSSNDSSTFPPALSHLKSISDHSISIFPVESSNKSSTPSSTITSNSPYNADFNYRQDFQTRHLSGGRASEYYPGFSQPQIGYPSTGYYPSGSSQRKDVKESLGSYPMSGTYDSGYNIPPNPFTAAAVSSNYPAARTAFSPGASPAPSTSSFPPSPAAPPTTQSYGSSSGSSEFNRMYSAFHRPEPSSTAASPFPPPSQAPPPAPTPHQYNPYNYNPFLMQPHPSYPHVPPSNAQNTSPP